MVYKWYILPNWVITTYHLPIPPIFFKVPIETNSYFFPWIRVGFQLHSPSFLVYLVKPNLLETCTFCRPANFAEARLGCWEAAGPNLGGVFLLLGTCCGGYFEKPKKVKNRWETTDTKKGRLGRKGPEN